jgi:hypothetical protein
MVFEINLRPAQPSDFFTNGFALIPNRLYFQYSGFRNNIEGPFVINVFSVNDNYYRKLFYDTLFKKNQSIFLPHYEDCDCKLNVSMRIAKAEDMKISKTEMKINYPFYLIDKETFLGPFILTKSNNPMEIKEYLDQEKIWIIDSSFNQNEILQLNKIAS